MPIRTEITLRLPNSPGTLADVCRQLTDARVTIDALSLEPGGTLRLIVDNHVHGLGILREHRHQVREREVIVLHVPGVNGAAPALDLVAGVGVNVEYSYTGVIEGQPGAVMVLGVDDALRAASVAGV